MSLSFIYKPINPESKPRPPPLCNFHRPSWYFYFLNHPRPGIRPLGAAAKSQGPLELFELVIPRLFTCLALLFPKQASIEAVACAFPRSLPPDSGASLRGPAWHGMPLISRTLSNEELFLQWHFVSHVYKRRTRHRSKGLRFWSATPAHCLNDVGQVSTPP